HTGEMIQVGRGSWRLVDVPATDMVAQQDEKKPGELEKLLGLLAKLDEESNKVPPVMIGSGNAPVDAFYRKRIDLLNKIIPLDKESEAENWYKQVFDNMTSLGQNDCDARTVAALTQLKNMVVANKKYSANIHAYGTYRELWTNYAVAVHKAGQDQKLIAKLTDKWLDDLADFVKTYPKADDTPDVLQQLAVGCEFGGKLNESKRWYKELADSFPDHYHTPRARGSLARLNLVNTKIALTAPYLADSAKKFDISQLQGKI